MLPIAASVIETTKVKRWLDSFAHSPTFIEFLFHASYCADLGNTLLFGALWGKKFYIDWEIEFGDLDFFQF